MTEITSENHSIVKTYEYDAYGNILQETGPSLTGGFTYTARELHTRSGLYYHRARFYSPELGRFITQDPIGHLGSFNLYGYVENNPVNYFDPLGLKTFVVADNVFVLAGDEGVLRFNDSQSYADAIASIPKGETEIVIIGHGDKVGGMINIGQRKIQGTGITDPLKANRGNFSQNVSIDLRVCYLFRGQLGNSIKCTLMQEFSQGTIKGTTGRYNYWLGTLDLWPFACSSIYAFPYLVVTPEGP
ncbi:MAG: hypothetical protein Kow0099_04100 [Candidatus Abyssubacteria bacterium]